MKKLTFKEFVKYNKGYLVGLLMACGGVLISNVSGNKEGMRRTLEVIQHECSEEFEAMCNKFNKKM